MPRVGGSSGAPSGAAGGVLDGTFPNPSFAVDMATQAELDAAQAALDAKRLDQVAAPTAEVSLNNQKIIGLAAPAAPTEAANKAYVDAIASGFDVKLSVRAATTANITLSGAQTIDGVSVIATNRVLVKNQTAADDNGIYVAAAGAWSRSTDADEDAEVTSGMFTLVEEGTTQADQGWALATNNPITLDTTALAFTQVSGVGGGGTPSGAAGGVLSGTYPDPGFADDMATQAELDAAVAAHTGDATAAHAASAISFAPDGSIAATTVQAAIIEVRDEAGVGGGSVNDQTIVTTDNTVNNLTTAKHGWAPKATGTRSHYLGGLGVYEALYPATTHAWYVDAAAAPGGDGLTPRTAFTSFNTANTAAAARDTIYILSDIQENGVLTKGQVRVQGVGKRVWYAQPGNSLNNTSLDVRALNVEIDNLWFQGHTTFRGVHLLLNNYSNYYSITNVYVNGTGGGVEPTFYETGAGGQTSLGGVGICCHRAEVGKMDNLYIINCSIGVGLGTWSTRATINNVETSQNRQDLVMGLYTGPSGAVALTTSPFGYGLVGTPAGNDQTGMGTFRNWSCVNNISTNALQPAIDLIGDKTTNYAGDSGFNNLFENMNLTESGGVPVFRVGTKGNTFINCYNSIPASWIVEGQRNHFVNTFCGNHIEVSADYVTFDGVKQDAIASRNGILRGVGNYGTYRNVPFVRKAGSSWYMSGFGNKFDGCTFGISGAATPISRADFGGFPEIRFRGGYYVAAYGTTVQPYAGVANVQTVTVTNGTAFTIANPLDLSNVGAQANILSTEQLTLDIYNNFGTMGAITWGSKYVLQTAITNPANTKHLLITFYYNPVLDKWVETNRVLHT